MRDNHARTPRKFSPEDRAVWRKSIPWSDEQIARACELESASYAERGNDYLARRWLFLAAAARRGFLYKCVIRVAIERLVRVCHFCSGKALYRVGTVGLCRDHRHLTATACPAADRRRNRLEHRAAVVDDRDRSFNALDLSRTNLKTCKKKHA